MAYSYSGATYPPYQPRGVITQQHPTISVWPSFAHHYSFPNTVMAGSTSDDQSVFDSPTLRGDENAAAHNASESSESPPEQQSLEAQQGSPDCPPIFTENSTSHSNPKIKRIACILCRRRKLKCDGERPKCSTCTRLKHDCGYDETRKKSGPKRGYVKNLENRLRQIEAQLESTGSQPQQDRDKSPSFQPGMGSASFDPLQPAFGANMIPGRSPSQDPNARRHVDPESSDSFPWEMMSLGLEEPLPQQDMINELHQVYFEKLHPTMPMVHKYRYLAAMNLAPSMRPPVALRYAIWSYACSATDKYAGYTELFYQRARKYAESDEMRGFGEQLFTVGHVQAWVIIANYEFKSIYFPRAWMSVGRAVRLAQMLGLYRIDGSGLEVKECLPKPKDWVDREERRRTFWAAYCFDRWASIGTGWPMNIDERDIHTELPSPEENFEKGIEVKSFALSQMLSGGDPGHLSSYSSVVLMASIIGKTLTHLHRTESRDDAADIEGGEFWKRHRYLDHILTNTTVCLPAHLQLTANIDDANVIFLHMNIHSVTICLHQAAILKAEQNNLGAEIIKNSTDRCYLAASEVAKIWRLISHVDISYLSPYVAFCLFVATRVFVHAYKRDSKDAETRQSLHFLLNAMEMHRKRNDITESFLMQLLVDLAEMGFDSVVLKRYSAVLSQRERFEAYKENRACPPVMPQHSNTQPTFKELQQQAELARMATEAKFRANMFPDQNAPASMTHSDDFDMSIPLRPAISVNDQPLPPQVHLDANYDLHVPYTGVSDSVGHTVYSHSKFPTPDNRLPFATPQPQQQRSPGDHGNEQGAFDFNAPVGFNVNLMDPQFQLDDHDNAMMQDLDSWGNLHENFGQNDEPNTAGPAWQAYMNGA